MPRIFKLFLLAFFAFTPWAYAEIYEVNLHQIKPDGPVFEALCLTDHQKIVT